MQRANLWRFCVGLACIFFVLTHTSAATKDLVEVHRIVAIGDIHGDADNFLKILRLADVIEDYKGGAADVLRSPPLWKFSAAPNASVTTRTTLVQMGDIVDRGEQDFESLNIAIALQKQVRQTATLDKVVLLIGNHELLNLQGQYHYVHKEHYGGFMSRPLRVDAMNPNGAFGKYIIDNFKAAYLDEDTLFVHAGIEADMAISDVDTLNSEVQQALRARNHRHAYLRSNGPLWTRKMIMDSVIDRCEEVEDILQRVGAARVVVGHTPQRSGKIEQYCGGRVIAADVGISRWMYNKVAALEMVFLKYFDTELQQMTTRYLFRELHEGGKAFSVEKENDSVATAQKIKVSDVYDDDGDL